MYLELKRLDNLRASELPQVATPFYAVGQLKSARAGYLRIRGFEAALESCTDPHTPFDRNFRERGFERLRQAVEQGDWVLVLDKSWPPISPAFQQVNDEWQVTHQVHSTELRHRLTRHAQILQQQQREQEILQSRNLPSSAPVVEPAAGPGNRAASLGPHVGNEGNGLKDNSFKTQHEAAASVSQKALPTSISEDREYGGMIYRNKDGTYGYTGPIKGEEGSVNPGGPKSVPPGTTAVAYWHTHGAYNPNYDSENFSNYYDEEFGAWVGDIPYAKHYGIDAYVVTPKGNFKYYSVKSDSEQLLGMLSTK